MLRFRTVARLVQLRYRLLWARTRLRSGRVGLLLVGSVGLTAVAVLLLLCAFLAVRAGVGFRRTEIVASVVLSGFFGLAVGVAAISGIGVDFAFSERSLRRYPLTWAERTTSRHLAAVVDPLWLVVLLLDLLAVAAVGWSDRRVALLGVPSALLLFASNYLASRVFVYAGRVISASRWGGWAAVILLFGLTAAPAVLRGPGVQRALMFTPPAAAARVLAGPPTVGRFGWTVYLLTLVVSLGLWVVWLECRARQLKACERSARFFAGSSAHANCARWHREPLVSKVLRTYWRSRQTRWNYLPMLVSLVALAVATARREGPSGAFLFLVGALGPAACISTGAFSMNVFGSDAAGFQRYFLLPKRPVAVFRTIFFVGLIPGLVLLVVTVVAWAVLVPGFGDYRSLSLMFSSGLVVFITFQAVGVWTSAVGPRPFNNREVIGNSLSFGTNALLVVTISAFLAFPLISSLVGVENARHRWWIGLAVLPAVTAFYASVVWLGARRLASRREQVMAWLEEN